MGLFSSSLLGDARSWYKNILHKSIKTWKSLRYYFIKRWEIKKDGRLLLTHFNQVKIKEVEYIDEFNTRFNTLIKEFPKNLRPRNKGILL
jgi:hypothetical protein